ncbi:Zinc finger BED domain-containing protein 5 [Dictyocoela muelleri]|nr:Zinc finger BED domain-containing protein 5 [Dictyocoela muelleri]
MEFNYFIFLDKEMKNSLIEIKSHVFYLSDIFIKLNIVTKKLQAKNCILIICKEDISSFIRKIEIYSYNINCRDYTQFQALGSISNELKNDDINLFLQHLENLHDNMILRFKDLLNLNIPNWIIDNFSVKVKL